MAASVQQSLSCFALDVLTGLSAAQKRIPPRYFYDDLGSALFEAITLLPEYELTRADERLLREHASEIALYADQIGTVAELGSGTGKKTRYVLEAFRRRNDLVSYRPIDVSRAALDACATQLESVCDVHPVCADWSDGLRILSEDRGREEQLLLMFVGSTIGNLDRDEIVPFLRDLRGHLREGDLFLLGADLVKGVPQMLAAYDDATGVTAAFNLNLLQRINRELHADFDLRTFAHEARWDEDQRRIEMHLLSCRKQQVHLRLLKTTIGFQAGETIWTESSHKFTCEELDKYARSSGFQALTAWVDQEWPFAEALWRAE
jgi:dimethylhistidine N-methyltransferase